MCKILKYLFLPVLLALTVVSCRNNSRDTSLEQAIAACAEGKDAVVGAAVLTEDGLVAAVNDSVMFPLMSVFKYHVALAVLDRMESENISPDSCMDIDRSSLHEDTYSPLRDRFPQGNVSLPLRELLHYSVALSDNNACDILIDFAGGVERVDALVRERTRVRDYNISFTEKMMHDDVSRVYGNWTRPSEMVRLMRAVDRGKVIGSTQVKLLEDIMLATETGPDKLKAGLPQDARLWHKTGSSDRNGMGMKAADNDAGFVELPDGSRYYIAVFVMNSRESDSVNASIIANISATVYEYLAKKVSL